jgi:hypothetical protein
VGASLFQSHKSLATVTVTSPSNTSSQCFTITEKCMIGQVILALITPTILYKIVLMPKRIKGVQLCWFWWCFLKLLQLNDVRPSSSGLRGRRRTYHTILKLADHALFKILLPSCDAAKLGHFWKFNLRISAYKGTRFDLNLKMFFQITNVIYSSTTECLVSKKSFSQK